MMLRDLPFAVIFDEHPCDSIRHRRIAIGKINRCGSGGHTVADHHDARKRITRHMNLRAPPAKIIADRRSSDDEFGYRPEKHRVFGIKCCMGIKVMAVKNLDPALVEPFKS